VHQHGNGTQSFHGHRFQNMQMAENNVTAAPFLPTLDVTSVQSASNLSTSTYEADGDLVGGQNRTNTWRTNLTLNWTLFDGLGMFATSEKQRVMLNRGVIVTLR
jgi:outer membrane protein TolC